MDSLFPLFDAVPRYLFLDMNAFFASCEQQEVETYRGKPTIVVPCMTDSTCAIAASYEAKKLGVKTGTSVRMARYLPDMQIVESRPELYLKYHARLVHVLNRHFTGVKTLSVDEVACPVPFRLYKTPQDEERLALKVKSDIRNELGEFMRCSVGVGPNVFLAKVAAERQKPDGLTVFSDQNLPDALFDIKLADLPGIGPAMRRRLEAVGIITVQELWEASAEELRRIWGSVVGARWWFMLRGSHDCDYQAFQQASGEKRKSVGHSNVLAPEHRSTEGAKKILLELFSKALKRLRAYNLTASAVQITVRFRRDRDVSFIKLGWKGSEAEWRKSSRKHLHANDEMTWLKAVRPILDTLPDFSSDAYPVAVNIVFSELLAVQDVNLSLFDDPMEKMRLAYLIDELNEKYEEQAVQVAGLHGTGGQVPKRIPFGAPDDRHEGGEMSEYQHHFTKVLPSQTRQTDENLS
jgi:DNA polymerase IV